MPSDAASEAARLKYRAELEAKMASAPKLNQSGACLCGSVKFHAAGPIRFSVLCHCKSCTRFIGVGPVHILGLNDKAGLTFSEGEDMIRIVKGNGIMRHAFCSQCGCPVYQHPDGVDFVGLFPATFHIEQGDRMCALPDAMRPKWHINYENRLRDAADDGLIKWKVWPNGDRLNSDGTPYVEPRRWVVAAGGVAAACALGVLVSAARSRK